MTKVNWGSEKIQQIIPHRYPMLLIDRVEEVVPGEMAIAKRNVTVHEEVFNGHFPHNPVLPGALIVESLAQTGAVALLSAPQFKGKTAYFGGIQSAEFRRVVRPGDTMKLSVAQRDHDMQVVGDLMSGLHEVGIEPELRSYPFVVTRYDGMECEC